MDEFREQHFKHHARQYLTLTDACFFGDPHSPQWSGRSDYPLRYFLWKINRDAWLNLWDWRVEIEAVFACVDILEGLLLEMAADAEALEEFDDDENPAGTRVRSVTQVWTRELDAFESWEETGYLTVETCEEWGNRFGFQPAWGMFDAAMALIHVTNAVDALDRGDAISAGALAIKARDSHFVGLVERGEGVTDWLARHRLARKGADKAHVDNRRLKAEAIELYEAGTWPSKMQAARVISKQVNRTEMVVLRWIREHTRPTDAC